MEDSFFSFMEKIGDILTKERPSRVLEIGGKGLLYSALIQYKQESLGLKEAFIDKICLHEIEEGFGKGIYRNVYKKEALAHIEDLGVYDFIFVNGLLEKISFEEGREIIEKLKGKTITQVMAIMPVYAENGKREYHPNRLFGSDYSYLYVPSPEKKWQIFSFYPSKMYPEMLFDRFDREENPIVPLKIAFIIPHQGLTGGMKGFLHQVKLLTERGHQVNLYFRTDKLNVLPTWSTLERSDYCEELIVPKNDKYLDYIKDEDVIFVGWVFQIREFLSAKIPVVLWEQGSEMLYGDYNRLLPANSFERLTNHALYRMPYYILAVSHTCRQVLKGIYNRNAPIFHCGIDTEFYYPREKDNELPVIFLVGNPALAFKGFIFMFDVLVKLWDNGARFKVQWASQINVQHRKVPFDVEVFVNPKQEKLAELYAKADIFFSGSLYESYPLPPLEAMASGTPVVAADSGGIRSYGIHEKNCLIADQGDRTQAEAYLKRLLENPEERKRFAAEGLKTATEHSGKNTIKALEQHLSNITAYHKKARQ